PARSPGGADRLTLVYAESATLIKAFEKKGGTEFDAGKATGTGKLLSVYRRGGRGHGGFDFPVGLPPKDVGLEEKAVKAWGRAEGVAGGEASAAGRGRSPGPGGGAAPDADAPQGGVTLDLRLPAAKPLTALAE